MPGQYQTITEDLRRLIAAGNWRACEQLPPEAELASLYRASLTTQTRVEVLEAAG
ncbi:GntR family transcriptional regulator [Streptomyces sp. NRRL B-1677]|uniref:GntR family transcriptional regulator n=1 Tax=Streptomyces sp. NRRL B-1677 TaxID=2682966 RepID=UPI001892A5C0|nr:GntR family transcriptional regulator [Streptomyces sp. NRRL B-1677]